MQDTQKLLAAINEMVAKEELKRLLGSSAPQLDVPSFGRLPRPTLSEIDMSIPTGETLPQEPTLPTSYRGMDLTMPADKTPTPTSNYLTDYDKMISALEQAYKPHQPSKAEIITKLLLAGGAALAGPESNWGYGLLGGAEGFQESLQKKKEEQKMVIAEMKKQKKELEKEAKEQAKAEIALMENTYGIHQIYNTPELFEPYSKLLQLAGYHKPPTRQVTTPTGEYLPGYTSPEPQISSSGMPSGTQPTFGGVSPETQLKGMLGVPSLSAINILPEPVYETKDRPIVPRKKFEAPTTAEVGGDLYEYNPNTGQWELKVKTLKEPKKYEATSLEEFEQQEEAKARAKLKYEKQPETKTFKELYYDEPTNKYRLGVFNEQTGAFIKDIRPAFPKELKDTPSYKERDKSLKGGLVQEQYSLDGGDNWIDIGEPYPRREPKEPKTPPETEKEKVIAKAEMDNFTTRKEMDRYNYLSKVHQQTEEKLKEDSTYVFDQKLEEEFHRIFAKFKRIGTLKPNTQYGFTIPLDKILGDTKAKTPTTKKVTPKSTTPKSNVMKNMPPASKHKDKTIEDTKTGKRYKSDGKNWIPLK